MATSDFPRVIVMGSSVFNSVNGSGFMLTNLFHGWPMDCLSAIHCDSLEVDTRVCQRFFRLTKKEMRWVFPFSLFQSDSPETIQGVSSAVRTTGPIRRWAKWFFGETLPWKMSLSQSLKNWIDEFRPQLLYVHPGMPYMGLALEIAAQYRLPMVIHMMDDCFSAYARTGVLGPLIRKQTKKCLEKTIEKAVARMAISPAMCEAFQSRYGVSFVPFYNGVDVRQRAAYVRSDWTAKSPFVLMYIGTIVSYAQRESLRDMCRVVASMAKNGDAICLEICSSYADQVRDLFEIHPAIRVRPAPAESEMMQTLQRADVLILPVNFDETSRLFLRYSFPAKLPLYMLTGIPILVYGPSDVGYVADALKSGWGCVVTARSDQRLQEAISSLKEDISLRQRIGYNGHMSAVEKHDLRVLRENFQSLLRQATHAARPSGSKG